MFSFKLHRCMNWKTSISQGLLLLLAPPPLCQHLSGPVMDMAVVSPATLLHSDLYFLVRRTSRCQLGHGSFVVFCFVLFFDEII